LHVYKHTEKELVVVLCLLVAGVRGTLLEQLLRRSILVQYWRIKTKQRRNLNAKLKASIAQKQQNGSGSEAADDSPDPQLPLAAEQQPVVPGRNHGESLLHIAVIAPAAVPCSLGGIDVSDHRHMCTTLRWSWWNPAGR
jgi:hypothetical protein